MALVDSGGICYNIYYMMFGKIVKYDYATDTQNLNGNIKGRFGCGERREKTLVDREKVVVGLLDDSGSIYLANHGEYKSQIELKSREAKT